jgi:hypothetical protein
MSDKEHEKGIVLLLATATFAQERSSQMEFGSVMMSRCGERKGELRLGGQVIRRLWQRPRNR